jgi:hypothetical protein
MKRWIVVAALACSPAAHRGRARARQKWTL